MDGGRLLVVDGGGSRAGRRLSSDTNPMVFCGIAIQRLTGPAKAAEDAEKTVLFQCSKVKYVASDASLIDRTSLSECNIITSHSLGTVPIWHWLGARAAERTV